MQESVCQLQLKAQGNKIRLINASDYRIEFLLTTGKGLDFDATILQPNNGSLEPRSWRIIQLDNQKNQLEDLKLLKLTYWKQDKQKKRISIGRLVPIELIKSKLKSSRFTSSCTVVKTSRIVLLSALIIYNIYLIFKLTTR